MSGDNKTEKATPKRRDEARRKGQVAKSVDVNSAAVLVAGVAVLAVTGSSMLHGYADVMRHGLEQTSDPKLASGEGLGTLGSWAFHAVWTLAAPVVLAAAAAGIAASVIQVRPKIIASALKPQASRINPLQGLKRLVGPQALFEAAKAIAKTAVVAVAAFLAIWPRLGELAAMTGMAPGAIAGQLGSMVLRLALYVCLAFAVIAALDLAWQRRSHEKRLRMTKEEVKQEARQSDVAPEVRGAIRRRQFQQARKRMIAEVATADVVVTNPTHYAVALRYDGSRPAPEVIAKGVDLVARAIREEAEKHDVTVLSNAPLARALYREVELGQMIPESFFAAVAEVLAFVYRAAARRGQRRRGRRVLQGAA